ncbi:MAG TPA: Arm DNA-binding domain-containing protein [Acidimicrobiales bacterium]|jgi:predicted DNA-binding transcriptional regulator AlpA|nr:Arm DNA-binding domain-containing protein [Acidimicrobiales bacterium]
MRARPEGVYTDARGRWDFKATVGRDPLTGKRLQVTKRGFRTAAEADRARQQLLAGHRRTPSLSQVGMLDELVSTVEIASTLGVSRQRVDKLSRTEAFPKPVAVLAIGRIWRRRDVEAWARETGRLN